MPWAAVAVTTTTLPNPAAELRHGVWLGIRDALSSVAATWQVWSVVVVLLLAALAVKAHEARRLARSGIADIDRMDGRTFEEYLGVLFRRLGYSAEVTPYSGDYGADLVVKRDGVRQVVQAKRSTRAVGPRAVQEVVAAQAHYGCQGAVVVTNSKFTPAARRLAADNGVKLWERRDLVGKVLELHRLEHGGRRGGGPCVPVADMATEGASLPTLASLASPYQAAPVGQAPWSCSACGARVSDKVRDYCLARPQRFAGKVYCYQHQRRPGP
jgi:restriction system protein